MAKLVDVLGLREMENDYVHNIKEVQKFTYEETNEYLLREYNIDIEHFLNRSLAWVWDEMYWGVEVEVEESDEDE